MTNGTPQAVTSEILNELIDLISNEDSRPSELALQSIRNRARAAINTSAAEAYAILGILDLWEAKQDLSREKMESGKANYENSFRLGLSNIVFYFNYAKALSNLGYVMHAYRFLKSHESGIVDISYIRRLSQYAVNLMMIDEYDDYCSQLEKMEAMNSRDDELEDLRSTFSEFLEDSGFNDDELVIDPEVLQIAESVLFEKNIPISNRMISAQSELGTILVQFNIAASYDEAADLGFECTDRLLESSIDPDLLSRFSVMYVGMDADVN